MQILAILFLGAFALGMGACVIKLLRDRDKLREDLYWRDSQTHLLQEDVVNMTSEIGTLTRQLIVKSNDLTAAHSMLEMVLDRDLENNQGFEQSRVELSGTTLNYQFNNKNDELGVVEVSRSGVLYLFDKAERINYEGNRRSDSKFAVASGDSSKQEAEVCRTIQDRFSKLNSV